MSTVDHAWLHTHESVINMGTKVYYNLPGFIKEIDDNKAFKSVGPLLPFNKTR